MMRNKNVRVFLILLALVCVGALGYYLFIQETTSPLDDPGEVTRLIQEGTIEACESATTEIVRFMCIEDYMTNNRDFNPAYCQNLDNSEEGFTYRQRISFDPLDDESSTDELQSPVRISTTLQSNCLLLVAEETASIGVCDDIVDATVKNTCTALATNAERALEFSNQQR